MINSNPRYPLGEFEKQNIRSKTGKRVDDITLQAIKSGQINADDIKISTEVLQAQSRIAKKAGRRQLAENFSRASEMVNIPDAVILEMYNKLRPNRSTKAELLEMIHKLETEYRANECAKLVRNALDVYEKRGVLL